MASKLFKPKERPQPPSLEVVEDGFSFVWSGRKATVRWADVKQIFAFKRDIFAYDLICLGFRLSDDGDYWEIGEDMAGYENVPAVMERAFPGSPLSGAIRSPSRPTLL